MNAKQLAIWNARHRSLDRGPGFNEEWNRLQGFPSADDRRILQTIFREKNGIVGSARVTMAEYKKIKGD